MTVKMCSVLILLSAVLGYIINTPVSRYALSVLAVLFELAVIIICVLVLSELRPWRKTASLPPTRHKQKKTA